MSDLSPLQEQRGLPDVSKAMEPCPQSHMASYQAAARLEDSVVLITSGDSGLGRALAVGFAKEGADVAFTYLDQHEQAQGTVPVIEEEGSQALAIPGDIGNSDFAREVVRQTVAVFVSTC